MLAFAVLLFSFVVDDYLSERFVSRLLIAISITSVLAAGEARRDHHPQHRPLRRVDTSASPPTSRPTCSPATTDCRPSLAIAFAVGVGAVLGLVNGLLVAVAKVPSIIATLGTLSIYRSVLTSRAGGESVATGELPRGSSTCRGAPCSRSVATRCGRCSPSPWSSPSSPHLVLQYTRGGRHLYAVGSNPEAARQAGLASRRVQIAAFVACGALAGFAGFLFVGRFGTINVTAGSGLELAAIAAAVVGGVSTLGGSGTVMGAFLGAVLIAVLDQSLVRVEQISEFWRDAILGALILLAVLLDVTRRPSTAAAGASAHPGRARCRCLAVQRIAWVSWMRRYTWELVLGVILLGTIAFNLSESSGYLSVDNFVNLFQLHIEKVIVVVTMTFVIIAGEIDLSVASVMAWSASVLAALHEHDAPVRPRRRSPPSLRRPSPG